MRTAVALLLLLAGCGACGRVAYVARGTVAEARLLLRREPIDVVLARPTTDRELRDRLELVLAVRGFAAQVLGLRVGDSFSTYVQADGDAIVWVVSAARRDRLEAHTWWYPIVGRVPYQGHFERRDAARAAAALATRGLDVDVRPASAFSTLGWFADPLLSTTARAGPVSLVETVLHELFHATLYVPGETMFNESAATFVGYRGAIAFFCDGPGTEEDRCDEARTRWTRIRAHGRVLGHYADRLRTLYARGLPPRIRERARLALARAAARTLEHRNLGAAAELVPPNNARLLGMLAYETELDLFERLAPAGADLRGSIAAVVAAGRAPGGQPFEAVRARVPSALQTHPTGIDSALPWPPSPSSWIRCSDGSPGGFACSGTTSPTGRTSTAPGWSRAPVARVG
jgi:predicted aminopeptidase